MIKNIPVSVIFTLLLFSFAGDLYSSNPARGNTSVTTFTPSGPFATGTEAGPAGDPYLRYRAAAWTNESTTGFEENRGQLSDGNGHPLPEVLFKAAGKDVVVYITTSGISYFFLKHTPAENSAPESSAPLYDVSWHRLDMKLDGAVIDKKNIITEDYIPVTVNHYTAGSPAGITVNRYKKITIKNIYPGIDWSLYNSDLEGMKYDFIVHPGSMPENIRMSYKGADRISQPDGSRLEIHTALGELHEGSVLCYEENGNKVDSRYLVSGDRISFAIGKYNRSKTLVIDPPLVWATYYGGSGNGESGNAITTDNAGNVFVTGHTNSANFPLYGMPGAYADGTLGGATDFFILKFNSGGVLQWATYYGGAGNDMAVGIVADNAGNIYVTGETTSADLPTQDILPGGSDYYQAASGGGTRDAFLVKFDNNGIRRWATYYGGTGSDYAKGIDVDSNGNIFVAGITQSSDFPTYNPGGGAYYEGAFQGAFDIFILKFNSLCERQWGTFYGSTVGDHAGAITVDNLNNVYVTGITNSPAFPTQNPLGRTYFQLVSGGSYDAFILKFNNAGARQWATFYGGGTGGGFADRGLGLTTDAAGNLYVTGETDSDDFPVQSMAGAFYQNTNGGGIDAYVLKFDPVGERLWATYYGGAGDETGTSITFSAGSIYITGFTGSTNFGTVDPGACAYYQSANGGLQDMFMLQFTTTGVLRWGTYYGGAANDAGAAITADPAGYIYVTGRSRSNNFPLMDPFKGAYFQSQNTGGTEDAIIAKFGAVVPVAAFMNDTICYGDTTHFADTSYFGGRPYKWLWNFGDAGSGVGNNTSTAKNPVHLFSSPGNFSVKLVITDSANCRSDSVTKTVIVNSKAIASAGADISICEGLNATLAGSVGGSATSSAWSTTGSGRFNDSTSVNTFYTPSPADIATGTVKLILTTNDPPGPCSLMRDTLILTIIRADDPSFSYSSGTFCQTGSDPSPTITGTAGGTFSSSSGLDIDPSTGKISLASSVLGTYTVSYTTNGPCPKTATFSITISVAPDASFSYNGPYCSNLAFNPSPTFPSGSSPGSFSAAPAGIVFANTSGTINMALSKPGKYSITNTIAAAGGCAADAETNSLTILPTPTSEFSVASPVCMGTSSFINYTGTGSDTANYTWSFIGGTIVSGDEQGPYTIKWVSPGSKTVSLIVAEAGCISTQTNKTVAVLAQPSARIADIPDSLYICPADSATVNVQLSGTGPWNVSYSENGVVKTFTSAASTYLLKAQAEGWYVLSQVKDNNCSAVVADSIYISHYPLPVLSVEVDKDSVCSGDSSLVKITLQGVHNPFDVLIDGGRVKFDRINDGHSFFVKTTTDTIFNFTSVTYSDYLKCQSNINVPVKITTYTVPEILSRTFTCNAIGTEYQVHFDISGGDTSSYKVNDTASGSSFTSGWITSGSQYNFTVTDKNNCRPVTITGTYRCNCTTDVGTPADVAPISKCEDMQATYVHNGDYILDDNDTLEYLLHDGSATIIGNILLRNNTGVFSYQLPLQYDTLYHITPVAGDHKGLGQVDATDQCFSQGVSIPVRFRELPDISLSALPNDSICLGDVANIVLNFTGVGPFDIQYTDGAGSLSSTGLFTGSRISTGVLSDTKTFTFTAVTGQYCSKNISKSLKITLPQPFDVKSVTTDITCTGLSNGAITTTVTGGYGNYKYTWKNSSGNTISTAPAAGNLVKGYYSLAVADVLGCSTTTSYTLTEPLPFVISDIQVVNEKCFQGNDGIIRVTAPGAKTYKLTDNSPVPNDIRAWQPDSNFLSLHFQPGTDSLVVIAENANGCRTDSAIAVTGLFPITLSVSPDQLVCPGGSVNLLATAGGGNGNFKFYWNGVQEGPVKTVAPSQPVNTYEIYVLDNNNCPSVKDTVRLTLPPALSQTVSPAQNLCFGLPLNLSTVASGGTGNYTYTWTSQQNGVVGNAATYSATAVVSDNYTITTTDTCGTTVQNTIAINVAQPVTVQFAALPDSVGCVPLEVTFINQGTGAFDRAEWAINGISASNLSGQFTHTFTQPGFYDITLTLRNSAFGCSYSILRKSYINVYPFAIADFEYEPAQITLMDPSAFGRNHSQYAANYSWMLDGIEVSRNSNPTIHFPADRAGEYELCLAAISAFGCNDTVCRNITVKDEIALYVPNTFTPDGDGHNDTFKAEYSDADEDNFHIQVFDRWGTLVFESGKITESWDGTYNGERLKSDIYAWKIKAGKISKSGKVIIMR